MYNTHLCVLREDGTVGCAGNNNQGAIGTGLNTAVDSPVEIYIPEPVEQLCTGWESTIYRGASGRVYASGNALRIAVGDRFNR